MIATWCTHTSRSFKVKYDQYQYPHYNEKKVCNKMLRRSREYMSYIIDNEFICFTVESLGGSVLSAE